MNTGLLLDHLKTCDACTAARMRYAPARCSLARRLIRQILDERHPVTNEQRRLALSQARMRSLDCAEKAEEQFLIDSETSHEYAQLAIMWASVAQSLKVGDPVADSTTSQAVLKETS